jgi:hypothetical protein
MPLHISLGEEILVKARLLLKEREKTKKKKS